MKKLKSLQGTPDVMTAPPETVIPKVTPLPGYIVPTELRPLGASLTFPRPPSANGIIIPHHPNLNTRLRPVLPGSTTIAPFTPLEPPGWVDEVLKKDIYGQRVLKNIENIYALPPKFAFSIAKMLITRLSNETR